MLTNAAEEERKTLISMLSKLHIPQSSSSEAIDALRSLLDLVNEVVESKLSNEASTRNVLNKLSATLTKHINTSAPSTEEDDEEGDTTTMTTTTAFAPDAEGTRMINMDEIDDFDEDADTTVLGMGERRQIDDASLVDSLLESEDDIV